MRVLMLSWEYPPVMVGGLGRHVHALATSLAAAGHHVTVVTRHGADAPLEEEHEGVRVIRAPEDPPLFPLSNDTLLAWTMAFNHALTRAALHAAQTSDAPYDVVQPTTGWSPTPRSPSSTASECRWSPPSTPPKRGATRAGFRGR
jgi:Glycogen synthase